MDLSSYISFSVKADISDKNAPIFVLTDDSVYPDGVSVVGYFNITQPDGIVRKADLSTPDISTNRTVSIPLRLASNNSLQCGDYTIEYTIYADGYTPTALSRTFNIAFTEPVISLTKIFDLFTPSLAYYDATVYNAGIFSSTIVRSWSANIVNVGTVTGSNSISFDLKYAGNYYDAAYEITFGANVTYDSTVYHYLSIVVSLNTIVYTDAYTPPSSLQLLNYLTQLKSLLDSLINSCQKYGKVKADYEYAWILYAHSQKRICANDKVGVITYIQEILNIIHNNVVINPPHTNAPISPYTYDCGGGGTPPSERAYVVEVFSGSSEAIAAGVTVGATVFTNTNLTNHDVEVIRGFIPISGIPTTDGGVFFTKVYTENFLTFSAPIQDGEYIKIRAL